MIVRGASEMRSFVDDLVASARSKDGILVVKPEVIDVGKVTDDVLEVVARVYERKTARNATAGVTAWADPLRIHQVLRNLIMNAFQYGGQHVEISAVRSQGRTIIEVRDDGIGVPPDLEVLIFDDYWGTGRAGDQGSLGIGLTLSKRLAEAMGGSLSYLRRGQTTVFALELPAEGNLER
jgi:signal transduction histidine kinase